MEAIDARGLSCPQPVILLKQALDKKPAECRILVDNRTALENTTRYDAICFSKELAAQGWDTELMPVPRKFSSSCGTCVRFSGSGDPMELQRDSIEQIIHMDTSAVLWDNR